MKHTSPAMLPPPRFAILSFFVFHFSFFISTALPPPLEAPLPPDFNPRPDLLDANQRRGVMLELNRLKNEVQEMRAEIMKDSVFDDIRAKMAVAKTNNVPNATLEYEKLNGEYQSMIMVLLRESDGIAVKQARILQLGRMLERDLPLFRNLERQGKGAVNKFFREIQKPEVREVQNSEVMEDQNTKVREVQE